MLQVALDRSPEGRIDERQMRSADRIDHGCGAAHSVQTIRLTGTSRGETSDPGETNRVALKLESPLDTNKLQLASEAGRSPNEGLYRPRAAQTASARSGFEFFTCTMFAL